MLDMNCYGTSWWCFFHQTHVEKYGKVTLDHETPNIRGEKTPNMWNHHLVNTELHNYEIDLISSFGTLTCRILQSGSWLVRSAFKKHMKSEMLWKRTVCVETALRNKTRVLCQNKKKLLQMQSAISESLNLYLRQFYLNSNFYDRYIYIYIWFTCGGQYSRTSSTRVRTFALIPWISEEFNALMLKKSGETSWLCWKLFKHSTMYNPCFDIPYLALGFFHHQTYKLPFVKQCFYWFFPRNSDQTTSKSRANRELQRGR